jgi:molybdopterin biosynthesis enzyme
MWTEPPQRIGRLTPLNQVLDCIEAEVKPVSPRSFDAAREAIGHVLAADVHLDRPLPQAPLALRDGFAVRADLTCDASSYAPAPVSSAVPVGVGEALPASADAVAPFDALSIRVGEPHVLSPVAPGEGVLAEGADLAPGNALLRAGQRLDRLRAALLNACGVTRVQAREPRLVVCSASSGDPAIINAIVAHISDCIRAEGAVLIKDRRTPGLTLTLTRPDADGVIVVGGTGTGRNDMSVAVLAHFGRVVVHGIALVPAETTAFGMVAGRPVLMLPGRIDGALAAWHVLGKSILGFLTENDEPEALRPAKLTGKVSSAVGIAELVAVRCDGAYAAPLASGYVPLSALARANGWILIPPESEGYPAHSEVMVRPWP